jgi:hypothetical protein
MLDTHQKRSLDKNKNKIRVSAKIAVLTHTERNLFDSKKPILICRYGVAIVFTVICKLLDFDSRNFSHGHGYFSFFFFGSLNSGIFFFAKLARKAYRIEKQNTKNKKYLIINLFFLPSSYV